MVTQEAEGAQAMRHASRTDANHVAVKRALEQCGAKVLDLSKMGRAVPDLFVTVGQRFSFVEVKTEKGKLSPEQQDFAKDWPVRVIRSEEEAYQMVRAMKA